MKLQNNVTLRVLERGDMEQIRKERNQLPCGILRTPYKNTTEEQSRWYEREIANCADSRTRYFGLEFEGQLVGYGGIEHIQWENGSGEISLLIFHDFKRRGFGQSALDQFIRYAFDDLRLDCVYAEVYASNPNLGFWDKQGGNRYYLPHRKRANAAYWGAFFYYWFREGINA